MTVAKKTRKVFRMEPAGPAVPKPTEIKDSNPKDAVGVRKSPISAIPIRVLWAVGLAMLQGALKYGRHNYRAVGVRASVYFDAVVGRHIFAWWEGSDVDPDSGMHPLDHAIAGLMVLRDSMMQGNWVDDRPPTTAHIDEIMKGLNGKAAGLINQLGHIQPHHYTCKDSLK